MSTKYFKIQIEISPRISLKFSTAQPPAKIHKWNVLDKNTKMFNPLIKTGIITISWFKTATQTILVSISKFKNRLDYSWLHTSQEKFRVLLYKVIQTLSKHFKK